jgi:hypothetical protein
LIYIKSEDVFLSSTRRGRERRRKRDRGRERERERGRRGVGNDVVTL